MRVLVTGSRDWERRARLNHTLDMFMESEGVSVIIEGEARGADRLAREWAEGKGIPVLPFPADWERYGRSAGPIRNRQMLVDGKPDVVIAFHPDIETSKGTKDMVRQAEKAGVRVIIVS